MVSGPGKHLNVSVVLVMTFFFFNISLIGINMISWRTCSEEKRVNLKMELDKLLEELHDDF